MSTIFFITFSTVVIEILYTRLFSVIYRSSFAFLMISLALFGYGLSGVFMSVSKIGKKENAIKFLEYFILIYALVLPFIYKITLTAAIDFLNLFNPFSNFLLLVLNCLALLIPFFAAGVSLVLIFTLYSSEIGSLYFIDLVGAALGGIALIPLITGFGPSKAILVIFFILSCLWFLISRLGKIKRSIVFILIVLSFLGMFNNSEELFPVVPRMRKRAFLTHYERGVIEHSKWSPINKIDVAPFVKGKKRIWIDAGTMQSDLVKAPPDLRKMEPKEWIIGAMPYQLVSNKGSAFIIGSAGGFEVLCAISHRFKNIVAVEMDPEICDLVRNRYAEYIGNLFQRKGVHLIVDEGRSVLKRLNRKFDVIQMVNSHNADTVLSGGLSIAESYTNTVESFKDYWNHLNDDGFVSIVHWFGERMFSTAFQALREMGVKNPERKFFVVEAEIYTFFFMKKGNLDARDIEILTRFGKSKRRRIVYSPESKGNDIYYRLASGNYRQAIKDSSVNISPSRDNSPYFNQGNKIGQFRFENNYIKLKRQDVLNFSLTYSNSVYLSILFISILFALIFIYLPLKTKAKDRAKRDSKLVLYFFCIGLSFIIVEIILIKIFQLYLGNPAYSISVIIFSLLVSSGIGSLLSKRINNLFKDRTILYLALFVFCFLIIYALVLFKIIYLLIQFDLVLRLAISFVLISILGIPMGVFFPTGLRYLGDTDKIMVGWAWGANAFATVLGSAVTVIAAINWDFSVALGFAALSYLFAGIVYHLNLMTTRRQKF